VTGTRQRRDCHGGHVAVVHEIDARLAQRQGQGTGCPQEQHVLHEETGAQMRIRDAGALERFLGLRVPPIQLHGCVPPNQEAARQPDDVADARPLRGGVDVRGQGHRRAGRDDVRLVGARQGCLERGRLGHIHRDDLDIEPVQ
jgi:hypothetical protein